MTDAQGGPGRGPRRSSAKEQMWRRHVARQERSKLSVRDYCEQAGISEPSFYAWRRELARRCESPAPLDRPGFLPVTIASPAAEPIELALPSGLVIRVPAGATAALRTILELVERPSC